MAYIFKQTIIQDAIDGNDTILTTIIKQTCYDILNLVLTDNDIEIYSTQWQIQNPYTILKEINLCPTLFFNFSFIFTSNDPYSIKLDHCFIVSKDIKGIKNDFNIIPTNLYHAVIYFDDHLIMDYFRFSLSCILYPYKDGIVFKNKENYATLLFNFIIRRNKKIETKLNYIQYLEKKDQSFDFNYIEKYDIKKIYLFNLLLNDLNYPKGISELFNYITLENAYQIDGFTQVEQLFMATENEESCQQKMDIIAMMTF